MKLNLTQVEIEAALKQYIGSQGLNTDGKAITFDFTAGRKGAGTSVEVVITDDGQVGGIAAAHRKIVETAKEVPGNVLNNKSPAADGPATVADGLVGTSLEAEDTKAVDVEAEAEKSAQKEDDISSERPLGQLPESGKNLFN